MKSKKIILAKKKILNICFRAKEGHIPSSYSILNMLEVLINKFIFKKKKYLNNFILSKGHAAIGYYVMLNIHGYITENKLKKFCSFASPLGGHPSLDIPNCCSATTGSLGPGFPVIAGMAFANKKKKYYCIIGDQECNEGTIWETMLLCSHHKLKNLTVLIDRNFSRNNELSLGNLEKKFLEFTKSVYTIDGHSNDQILRTLKYSHNEFKIIIAKTVKGYGIKEMENNNAWHHKFPKDLDELKRLSETILY